MPLYLHPVDTPELLSRLLLLEPPDWLLWLHSLVVAQPLFRLQVVLCLPWVALW